MNGPDTAVIEVPTVTPVETTGIFIFLQSQLGLLGMLILF